MSLLDNLKEYQKEDIQKAIEWDGKCLIANCPGSGKTVEALSIVTRLNAFPCLIETISGGKPTWARESSWWLEGNRTVSIIEGIKKNSKLSSISVLLPDLSYKEIPINDWNAEIIIINYDILSAWEREILNKGFKSIVFDESHKLRNSKTIRFKYSKQFALKGNSGKEIPVRLCLSATPILNHPSELIPQLQLIGKLNEVGGYWVYINKYCDPKDIKVPYFNKKKGVKEYRVVKDITGVNKRNLPELNLLLKNRIMIRRTTKEILPWMEPNQRIIIPTQLNNWEEYVKVEDDFINWIGQAVLDQRKFQSSLKGLSPEEVERAKELRAESAEIVARRNESLIKLGYLRQIAARGKLPAVVDWLENAIEENRNILVFIHHQEIQQALAKRFPTALHIYSTDSKTKALQAEEEFQTNPNKNLLFLSMHGSSESKTLTKANTAVFPELDWTPAILFDQCEGRASGRVNNPHNIISYFFLAHKTIDDYMWMLLKKKKDTCDLSTDGIINKQEYSILGDLKKTYFEIAKERLFL